MSTLKQRPNLICIISDTFRADYMECYGNEKIHTPNLDAFAAESAVFDCAYPESLPTIPARRALHTGRRADPFRGHKPLRWLTVYQAGWQPMDEDEDTLAENLVEAGYYTGFVSDTQPYFSPGMNLPEDSTNGNLFEASSRTDGVPQPVFLPKDWPGTVILRS